MKRSTDRILTTHVGSLPRDNAVVDLLFRREQREPYDAAEFDRIMASAVSETVRKQVEIGIDVVSDGETSKIGYATYIKDRLTGFDGDGPRQIALDLQDYPDFRSRMAVFAGRQTFKRQSCVGPIQFAGHDDLEKDLVRFRAAITKYSPVQGFLNAASPGVVSAFQPNRHYSSHAAYVEAIGNAMQVEYEAIVNAGFILQLDCPDLAMARHTGFQDLTESEFLKRADHQVEVMNHAVRNIPADSMRMHVCWGNYEGPHDRDVALRDILAPILKANAGAFFLPFANPRHAHEFKVFETIPLRDDQLVIAGVIDTLTNFVEHPEVVADRIERIAAVVGAKRVIAATDCGFDTSAGMGRVAEDVVWAKLRALRDGARLASGRLFGT
jgi:5-methyltetrahydropteroyltriglutamate--homocysteine methyltransferase